MSGILEITDEQTWQERIEDAHGTELVELFVTWCPHCQREAPIIDSLADDIRADGIEIYCANAEVMYTKGDEYGLTETPSFILVKDGRMVAKHEGFLEPDEIFAFAHAA